MLKFSRRIRSLSFRMMTTKLPNNGWFLSQVSCFVYVPIFGFVIFASYLSGDLTAVSVELAKLNN